MHITIKTQGRLLQYLATFSATFSLITSGVNVAWTSPYLPQLLTNTSHLPMSNSEASWCAIMPLFGVPVGCLIAAIFADIFGRKSIILLTSPIIILSFIGMAYTNCIFVLSLIRFTIGTTEGVLFTTLPTYIGEISHPQIRGFLTSMISVAYLAGTLVINVIGPVYSIFTSSLICVSIPVVHFSTFIWMPESPYYYIKKKKLEEARHSLELLTRNEDVGEEMERLCQAVERQEANKGKMADLYTVHSNRRAFFICLIVCFAYAFSGETPLQLYIYMIFSEAGTTFSPEMSVIIYTVVGLITTLGATFTVDVCGRRPLFVSSALGCSICFFVLGTYYFLKDLGIPHFANNFGWLPLIALILYNILFRGGLGLALHILNSELFPMNVKTKATSLCDSTYIILSAVASKFFYVAKDKFGIFVPFWTFGVCCFVGLVLIAKFVPETKGKTLEEIQFDLNGNKSDRRGMES